jgi:hypothetical protein
MEPLQNLSELLSHPQCNSETCDVCQRIKKTIPKHKTVNCWSPASQDDLTTLHLFVPNLYPAQTDLQVKSRK